MAYVTAYGRVRAIAATPADRLGLIVGENIHIVPYAQAVRGAVMRLASSSAFATSPKLMAFLRFAVESVLAGDAHSLKAYTIGTGALGRRTDFDPTTDAIVRVEAGRLREALTRYYEGEGATDPVIIDMPRGSYVPNFAWRNIRQASAEPHAGYQNLVLWAECQRLKLLLQETARARLAIQKKMDELRVTIDASKSTVAEAKATLAAAGAIAFSGNPPAKLPRAEHGANRPTRAVRPRPGTPVRCAPPSEGADTGPFNR